MSHAFKTYYFIYLSLTTYHFLMVIQRQAPALVFFPVKVFITLALLYHGNAIVYRAYYLAEIAAHAFIFFNRIRVVGFAVR